MSAIGTTSTSSTARRGEVVTVDAVVIGAGFSGLYALHRLRDHLGLDVRAIEASAGVGGTWYTNRYPGARCDTESYVYCYSFSPELLREWRWSSKYPEQAELLTYFEHVATRFDLWRSIDFGVRVRRAAYDEGTARWIVESVDGPTYDAQFVVSAMGTLSAVPYTPDLAGLDEFEGQWYHTGAWPHRGVDLAGKRVAVIGTGSTGVQTIPVIAEQAGQLYVFQRSPQYTIPARHAAVDDARHAEIQDQYPEIWSTARASAGGFPWQHNGRSAVDETDEQRLATLEALWAEGGLKFVFGSYRDLLTSLEANRLVADFVRAKIVERVGDPALAEQLVPTDHPFGSRRPVIDTEYFETYQRPNVTLVDLRGDPLVAATATGLRTETRHFDLDVIVFATGFDAVTGPFMRLDLTGQAGESIQQHWADGPRSYLGLAVNGFPNLFTITGPGSTFGNHAVTMEHHVEWIADCIGYMRDHGVAALAPRVDAETAWGDELREQVRQTVVVHGRSWWSGENIPGKPKRPLFSVASHKHYRRVCDAEAEAGYPNFERIPARAGDPTPPDPATNDRSSTDERTPAP